MPAKPNYSSGIIALLTIIIISAVAVIVAVSVSLLGVREIDTALAIAQASKAKHLAKACLEDSLIRLKNDFAYTGGTLNLANGSCTMGISGIGRQRTINIDATLNAVGNYHYALQAEVYGVANSVTLTSVTVME